ncbi:MAG: hypothetical protein HY466_07580 [Deltaproteobacteria bacterium]|nr:hypothetical protein [Deltaproteobacteria bacterium]
MQFVPSLGLGLLVGLANTAAWLWGGHRLIKKGGSKTWVAFLGLFKLGILAFVIWVLMQRLEMDPIGFLTGFSATVILLLSRILKWN